MATPNDKDRATWKKNIEKFKVGLEEDGSPKRKMDENKAKALFRDSVRKKWMYCNTKLLFEELSKQEDTRPNTRTKWIWQCAKCGDLVPKEQKDIDHIIGDTEFTDWSKAHQYASAILDVNHSGLQVLCNDKSKNNCHATKTRAETLGIDWTTEDGWNRALMEQEFTRIINTKAKGQKDFLLQHGVEEGKIGKNEEIRKQQIREILEGNV